MGVWYINIYFFGKLFSSNLNQNQRKNFKFVKQKNQGLLAHMNTPEAQRKQTLSGLSAGEFGESVSLMGHQGGGHGVYFGAWR